MDTILAPVTSHPGRARDVARAVIETESQETTAIVGHVLDDAVESSRAELETSSPDALAAQKNAVAAATEELEAAGIETRVRDIPSDGEIADAIVTFAVECEIDRIYVFNRKRNPAGKAVFGSTVQQLLLDAPCPVVVLPSGID